MTGGKNLGKYATGRDNNFNLIRMIAAICVLVSHAYPIALGAGTPEPLQGLFGTMTLGSISVLVFFAVSGFFITKSYYFSNSWRYFLVARALRLFPALFVVLVVTVLVSGFFLTTADAIQFWTAAPGYILQNLTLAKMSYSLPGVFDTNPYGTAINGSLWSLFYEVVCYIGVFLAGVSGLLFRPRVSAVLLGAVFVACMLTPYFTSNYRLLTLSHLALPFAIGAAFFLWRDRIVISPLLALGLCLAAAALLGTEAFKPVFILALSYAVFVLGYWPSPTLSRYNRLGDYSYGTYIYAFPVQQLFASHGVTDPIANIALSLPVTLVCAILSWHLVERIALDFKLPTSQRVAS